MHNKKLLTAALALLLLMAVMLSLWQNTREQTQAGIKEITVTVVHPDGDEKTFRYRTREEYLGQVLLQEGLVQGEAGPYGLEIFSVDGQAADWQKNRSYWALYIGEEYATTGADGIVLTDGGAYSLVYAIG